MPSKSSSNLRSNTSSKLQCDGLRCAQLFSTMLGRSALSYLASKISTTHLVALRVLVGSWAKLELSLSALEMLDLSCRLLIFLMGRRTSSMVMVFSLKSNTALISCKVCLPMIRSYNGFSFGILHNVWVQVHLFACWIFHKRELNFTHLLSFEGAIGSVPWLWDSPYHNGYVLIRSFFQKKEVPTWSCVQEDPDSLMLCYQSFASVFWWQLGLL